jgi:hypothetical protein
MIREFTYFLKTYGSFFFYNKRVLFLQEKEIE